jgi:hypothetical protein
VWAVRVEPWVQADIAGAGLTRATLNLVHFHLHNHLPGNLAAYQGNRIARSPRCFWYNRIYPDGGKLHGFEFVVRDSTPGLLEVIWVLHTT